MKYLIFLWVFPIFANVNMLIFAGSVREGSYNKRLSLEAAQIAKAMGANVTWIDLKEYSMPFYDADLEAVEFPENAKKFRNLMAANDIIVIASPEYNSSLSPLLKNALDWASRTDTSNPRHAFNGKIFAVMSASPGGGGGARGLVHLRSVIEAVGGKVVKTQVTVPKAFEGFTEKRLPALRKEIQALLKESMAMK